MSRDYLLRSGISTRQLIAELKEGILILDVTGKILDVNSAEMRRSGFGLKYYRSKNIEELFDAPPSEIIQQKFQHALQGKRSQPLEVAGTDRKGDRIAASIEFAPLDGTAGLVILGIVQDLKEQIDLENRLQFCSRAIESGNDAVMMADETGRVFYANRATGKITGKPIGELLGKSFTDSLLEGKPLKTIESLFRQGRWSADFNRLQADGKRFSYQVTVFHLTKADDSPSGYLVMARDITRERRGWEKFYQILRAWEGEKAAQKSSQRIQQDDYEALLDSAAAGVFVENKKGLVLVNKTFTALTGHSADSLPSPSFLDLVVYKYKRKVGEYFDHVFQQRELSTPFREQCRLATKGGSQVEVSLTLAPLVFRHEVTVAGTILDTSEIRDLQTKLINSDRLVNTGKLAATIVHEFSRPLESVFTAIQSVKEDPLSRRQRDACRMVEDDLGHIKETMGHMISMYEFKHQKKSFVTLDEILRNTLDLLKKHLEKNSIKVQLNLSPYVSEVLVSPHQILQLFVALSQYSLSSMPSGGRLTVSSQKRGRTVIVIFEDTGIGMPEKELKRLFDPFYSWQDGDNWELGLHAAYDIVRQHNGEIKAGSTLGKGTRFVITLPVSS